MMFKDKKKGALTSKKYICPSWLGDLEKMKLIGEYLKFDFLQQKFFTIFPLIHQTFFRKNSV